MSVWFWYAHPVAKPRGDLQLAIGYWIVSHKDQLRTWWAVSLLSVIAGSFLWAIGFYSVFFIQQVAIEKNIAASATSLAAYGQSSATSPRDLAVSDVTVIRRTTTHVDLVVMVTNDNADWGAQSAVATWQVAGATIAPETFFINPKSERPLMVLNVAVSDPSAVDASVSISQIVWGRASAAPLPDPNFSTAGLALSARTVQTPDGDTITTVNVRGDILNQSVYNFFRVTVPLIVRAGERIVAVDQITQTAWPTLMAKSINVTWSYPVVGATSVEAWPQVSRFDADNLYR